MHVTHLYEIKKMLSSARKIRLGGDSS